MTDQLPIHNSRLMKNFVEYLSLHYPGTDIDFMLEYAGMRSYEVEDPAHWFTQEQVNRFHEILALKTGEPHISREVGRFAASSRASSPLKKYALGFMNPHAAYRMVANLSSHFSKGFALSTRKVSSNCVEVTATPNPGVTERPFQCENRMGMLEALAKIFTNRLAQIEHPTCMHKGDKVCKYVLTWEETGSLSWKRFSMILGLISLVSIVGLLFLLPVVQWMIVALCLALAVLFSSFRAERLERRELASSLEVQGDTAKERLEEINLHYRHAQLIQDIGQATSTILNVDELMGTVAESLRKHLDFDRGLLMLADENKACLVYKAGYGYSKEQEELLRQADFGVGSSESKGLFTLAFREQRPFLLDDIFKFADDLSKRSLELAEKMGVRSLICVPITYQKQALGLLAVDNMTSRRPLTQTDVSLLMGIASQIAVSVTNALSFKRLEESERKYRDLVENANSIILRLDTQGNILFFNEFAQKFFGHADAEVLGKNVLGTILPPGEEGEQDLAAMIGDTGRHPARHTAREIQHIKPTGEPVWVAWTQRRIYDESGKISGVLCIGSDITQLKRAADEKRNLEALLMRAQKMEAIGTLAGGVAHDLNNIMAGLVSYPEILLMDVPPNSPMFKPLMTIKKSGERAASIVQDLLTLARRGVGTAEVVRLNRVIEDYVKSPEFETLKAAHPGLHVVTALSESLFHMVGSPVHLSKTVMNLVTNAAEAMPSGGTIRITTENRYVDHSIRGYDNVEEGDYIVLSVSDTGVGIAPEDVERIFEPFYTKKVMGRSGTGLGMAVVWGTVKDHHGYIDVQSTEGKGTTFRLYFPVSKRELAEEDVHQSIQSYMGRGETILVVDDVAEQREIASLMLMKLGYRVSTLGSGEAAVEFLKNQRADLLLLDMIMQPGMDGLETYKKVIEISPGQRAIIVSGYSETDRVREAQRLGVGCYIRKPFAMESIGMAIREELER